MCRSSIFLVFSCEKIYRISIYYSFLCFTICNSTLKKIVSHIYVASYSVAGSHMKMCRSRMCRIPDVSRPIRSALIQRFVVRVQLHIRDMVECTRATHFRCHLLSNTSQALVIREYVERSMIEIGLPRSGSIEIKSTRGGGSPDVAVLCSANARKI